MEQHPEYYWPRSERYVDALYGLMHGFTGSLSAFKAANAIPTTRHLMGSWLPIHLHLRGVFDELVRLDVQNTSAVDKEDEFAESVRMLMSRSMCEMGVDAVECDVRT